MKQLALSDKAVSDLATREKEYIVSDGKGLYIRVRPSGSKNWYFSYRQNRKLKKVKIGSFDVLSVTDAREKAREIKYQIAKGLDPKLMREISFERQTEWLAKLQEEQHAMSLESLFYEWKKDAICHRKDKGKEIERSFKADLLPVLGEMKIDAVQKEDIVSVLEKIKARGSNMSARTMLANVRQMFNYALDKEWVKMNPTIKLNLNDWSEKTPRERTLSKTEILTLSQVIDSSGLKRSHMCVVWILLATGCRINDLVSAKWKDIDLIERVWEIPDKRFDGSKKYRIHLSDFALGYFKELKGLSNESIWVLPSRGNDRHISGKALSKQISDRQRTDIEGLSHRTSNCHGLVVGTEKWTLSDLRRTCARIMSEEKIDGSIILACLGLVEAERFWLREQKPVCWEDKVNAWNRAGESLSSIINIID